MAPWIVRWPPDRAVRVKLEPLSRTLSCVLLGKTFYFHNTASASFCPRVEMANLMLG